MPGPQFVRFFNPLLDALRHLGDSGTPPEVCNAIAEQLGIPEETRNEQTTSGVNRFENQVAWARYYLAKAGYLDSSERGIWSLTDTGRKARFSDTEAYQLFKTVHEDVKGTVGKESAKTAGDADSPAPLESTVTGSGDYRHELLEIIRSLPAAGFERLCQRLLREAGFREVVVTGRTGDGGIDGRGLLQINSLLSIQVVFQSKRYDSKTLVGAPQIRDLRGAMAGRTDRGICITTSGFTPDARKEALREGVPPIELVDAEKLVGLFSKLQLGLVPRTVFEVNKQFFDEFRS
jgi:restriction system protein